MASKTVIRPIQSIEGILMRSDTQFYILLFSLGLIPWIHRYPNYLNHCSNLPIFFVSFRLWFLCDGFLENCIEVSDDMECLSFINLCGFLVLCDWWIEGLWGQRQAAIQLQAQTNWIQKTALLWQLHFCPEPTLNTVGLCSYYLGFVTGWMAAYYSYGCRNVRTYQ